MPVIRHDAAGVDIGARQIMVGIPPHPDHLTVRTFTTFTDDLCAIRDWLIASGVRSVVMESTSVYWIPLYQILSAAGIEVLLVNSRHVPRNPKGKTDILDCQWLQYLHSVGLLQGSFRPSQQVCAVRTLIRHRDNLIQGASSSVLLLHKALTQMNLQIHHVISDITGTTGLAILNAILSGERDPHKLAAFKNPRIKASTDTLVRSLIGDWRDEHLFVLRQAFQTWSHFQSQIADTDQQIHSLVQRFEPTVDLSLNPPPATKTRKPQRNEPTYDLRTQIYAILGTDLTLIPAIQTQTLSILFSELGPGFTDRFDSSHRFCSWLGLSPDNRVTGGKIIKAFTRRIKHRVATALRIAAQSLSRSKSYLGNLYRRLRARLGAPKANTALAHKLARIIYTLCKRRISYDLSVWELQQKRLDASKFDRLKHMAASFGYSLTPSIPTPPSLVS